MPKLVIIEETIFFIREKKTQKNVLLSSGNDMTRTDKVCDEKTQICQKQYTTLYTFAGNFFREAEQAVNATRCVMITRRFVFFVLFYENSSAIDKNRVNLKIHKQHRDSAPRNRLFRHFREREGDGERERQMILFLCRLRKYVDRIELT